MEAGMIFVPVNIDLNQSGYDRALIAFANHLEGGDCSTEVASGVDLSSVPASGAIHVALFFERSVSVLHPQSEKAEAKLNDILVELGHAQLKQRVHTVSLVDCGGASADPLSDFSVLRSHLETVTGYVTAGTLGRVFAIDFDGELDTGYPMRVFDSESNAFRQHLAQHINRALSKMNGSFRDDTLPEFAPQSSWHFDQALSRIEKLN